MYLLENHGVLVPATTIQCKNLTGKYIGKWVAMRENLDSKILINPL